MEATIELAPAELVIRLLLAGLFGAVVGFEREWRERTAGLRTHMMVCIGATAFTLVSIYAFSGPEFSNEAASGSIIVDPGRIAAQIVSGIGFLGAGAILHSKGSVAGLTTAASLWAMAAIGMAVGAGQYSIAGGATLIIVFVLAVLRRTSERIKELNHHVHATLDVHVCGEHGYEHAFRALETLDISITRLAAKASDDGGHKLHITIDIPPKTPPNEIVERMLAGTGIASVSIEHIDVPMQPG